MKTRLTYFGKNGSGWKWLSETLYLFALIMPLAAAIMHCLSGVIIGSANNASDAATDQDAEASAAESYTISYEDFNHVKPGPSVTAPPAEPQA